MEIWRPTEVGRSVPLLVVVIARVWRKRSITSDFPKTKRGSVHAFSGHTMPVLKFTLLVLQLKQKLNQSRRDGHRADLNALYKGFCTTDTTVAWLLYGDELPSHIKAIGETNRLSNIPLFVCVC